MAIFNNSLLPLAVPFAYRAAIVLPGPPTCRWPSGPLGGPAVAPQCDGPAGPLLSQPGDRARHAGPRHAVRWSLLGARKRQEARSYP